MSLWKNNDLPTSAPKWYARHCLFKGNNVDANGKLDLQNSNTQYATGDCVIYYATTPITGLTNEGVYYLRKDGNHKYSVCTSRANALNPTGPSISLTAVAATAEQLFIKYDTKLTTADGTEDFAMVPISAIVAAKRIGGMNSPGWYRYRKYTDHNGVTHVNRELLTSVRTMSLSDDEPPELSFTRSQSWTTNKTNTVNVTITGKDYVGQTATLSLGQLTSSDISYVGVNGTDFTASVLAGATNIATVTMTGTTAVTVIPAFDSEVGTGENKSIVFTFSASGAGFETVSKTYTVQYKNDAKVTPTVSMTAPATKRVTETAEITIDVDPDILEGENATLTIAQIPASKASAVTLNGDNITDAVNAGNYTTSAFALEEETFALNVTFPPVAGTETTYDVPVSVTLASPVGLFTNVTQTQTITVENISP